MALISIRPLSLLAAVLFPPLPLLQVALRRILWRSLGPEQETVSEDQRLPQRVLGVGRRGRRHLQQVAASAR